tara:strand:+ start:1859 stop:2068 length:210 start_codon:yes stop_codon:yes gene_type:complete
MLDAMAQRYGVLPSRLLQEGDTFDLMIMDVALTYQNYKNKDSSKQYDPQYLDQDALQQKLEKARNDNKG